MLKRIISAAFAALMLFALVPVSAFAGPHYYIADDGNCATRSSCPVGGEHDRIFDFGCPLGGEHDWIFDGDDEVCSKCGRFRDEFSNNTWDCDLFGHRWVLLPEGYKLCTVCYITSDYCDHNWIHDWDAHFSVCSKCGATSPF